MIDKDIVKMLKTNNQDYLFAMRVAQENMLRRRRKEIKSDIIYEMNKAIQLVRDFEKILESNLDYIKDLEEIIQIEEEKEKEEQD